MNFLEKARRFCRDIILLAQSCRNDDCRLHLERFAHQLLGAVSQARWEAIPSLLTVLESFISLGEAVYAFNKNVSQRLLTEIASLRQTINSEVNSEMGNNSEMGATSEFPNYPLPSPDLNSEIRQSAIVTKIKEFSGSDQKGCGLKDLMVAFPDVTDRTLRYDLDKLLQRGLVVKIGTRGPHTIYRIAGE